MCLEILQDLDSVLIPSFASGEHGNSQRFFFLLPLPRSRFCNLDNGSANLVALMGQEWRRLGCFIYHRPPSNKKHKPLRWHDFFTPKYVIVIVLIISRRWPELPLFVRPGAILQPDILQACHQSDSMLQTEEGLKPSYKSRSLWCYW